MLLHWFVLHRSMQSWLWTRRIPMLPRQKWQTRHMCQMPPTNDRYTLDRLLKCRSRDFGRNSVKITVWLLTVPHRKCQMDHVCHKNKCCQSNLPKQYKNTDFLLKNNYLGNTGSVATAPSFFSCCYGTSVAKIIIFGWKISVLILLFVSYFGNIYFFDKHDPFDICDAARYFAYQATFDGRKDPF